MGREPQRDLLGFRAEIQSEITAQQFGSSSATVLMLL